jgi:Putative TM nitroreductase
MYDDIKIELKIISSDDVKRRMMKKAPHYIAIFSEAKEGYLTNVGFMLQQMDLLFSANGIGSCWQGIPQPSKDVLKSSNLEFVILMAFGKPNEPLHRSSVSQFKRKPLPETTDIKDADELLEAARLAPSAGNSQSWFFTGDENIIHAYSVKPSFLRRLIAKKYIPIDMGIAIYHLKVAAEHYGKTAEIIFDETAEINVPQGYKYIASLKID